MTLTVGPVTAPAGANLTTALPLQPGTVVDARVLQILESGLTRILIADVTLDVASTANLIAGTDVRLAVSQTPQGIQLAVVEQGTQGAALPIATSSSSGSSIPVQGIDGGRGSSAIAPEVSNAPPTATTISSNASLPTVASVDPAPVEISPAAILRNVVASATETAATRQASLAPLFANVDAVALARPLPPAVAAAAERLLALRPDLGTTLQGDDLKAAFNNSGLFLESALKTAALTGSAAPSAATPDLKAALLVLRQVLSLWSDASPSAATSVQSPATELMTPEAVPPVQSSDESAATPALATNNAAANANLTKPATGIVAESTQTNTSSPEPLANTSAAPAEAETSVPAGAIAATQRAVMLKASDVLVAELLSVSDAPSIASDVPPRNTPPIVDVPPPPWRGAAPSAQPISSATLAPLASDSNIARTLLSETDAALARQTLHQIASLPDGLDINSANTAANLSNVSSGPRWSFEIPFATPQGTAVAQFEISGDGGGDAAQASSQKVWRARFTIDVEPTGPVHARVAMMAQPNGAPKTSVRLWAERSETQMRLQSGADQLVQALRGANLDPETILIGEGKPPANTVPSGRFLNRAS